MKNARSTINIFLLLLQFAGTRYFSTMLLKLISTINKIAITRAIRFGGHPVARQIDSSNIKSSSK